MCRAEQPGRFAVAAGVAGQSGEAFQDVGDEQVRLDLGGTRERVMGVALGLVWLTLLRSPRGRASSARPTGTRPHDVDTASSAQRRAATRSPPASAASAL